MLIWSLTFISHPYVVFNKNLSGVLNFLELEFKRDGEFGVKNAVLLRGEN